MNHQRERFNGNMNTIGVLKKRKVDLFSANSLYTFAVLKFQDLFIPYMFDYYWKSKALEVFIEKKKTKFVQNWSVFKIYGGSYTNRLIFSTRSTRDGEV